MGRLIKPENQAQGVTGSTFQAGVNDLDNNQLIETGITLPWNTDPKTSWVYYELGLGCQLDSGIVLHKALPQSAQPIDTLASGNVMDPAFAAIVNGPNQVSGGSYTDVVQRMATSDYRFFLKGKALRVGYQIPCPGLKTICGITAYPDQKQYYYPYLVGNYGGVPLWYAEWELWYFLAGPPKTQQVPPPNIAQQITGSQVVPKAIQVPWSQSDQNAKTGGARTAGGSLRFIP